MKQRLTLTFFATFILCVASAQDFEKLKLTAEEVPDKYTATDKKRYKSIQAGTFYEQTDLYATIIGKVAHKAFQSYESADDTGGIYYYEFEEPFEDEAFLQALLWGGKKPTKAHPEEIFVKDHIVVIWSLGQKSALKKISKDKITALLK